MGFSSSCDSTVSSCLTRPFVSVHLYRGCCRLGETLSHHMYCPSNLGSFVQPWLCSHVRSLSPLYSATQPARRWSTPTYRQLLDRSLGMFRKNNVNARESCICSVMTDIIKQFRLGCNWFNTGRTSLLAAHSPACFLQPTYILTPVALLWTPRPKGYREKKIDLRLFFRDRLPVMLLCVLSRQSSSVSDWTFLGVTYIDVVFAQRKIWAHHLQ